MSYAFRHLHLFSDNTRLGLSRSQSRQEPHEEAIRFLRPNSSERDAHLDTFQLSEKQQKVSPVSDYLVELQSHEVDAVTKARWFGAFVEDMAKMGVAP